MLEQTIGVFSLPKQLARLVKETQIEIETNMNIFSVPIILNLKTKQLTELVKEISEWKVVRN